VSSEQRGFVFALTFIVVFSTLLSTIPTGLQGQGDTPDMITPLDPSIISDFSDSIDYTESDFVLHTTVYWYEYDLGGKKWLCSKYAGVNEFELGSKVLIGGILWLGQLDSCKFLSVEGENRGSGLNFTEIETDATDGTVRYSLLSLTSGNSAGGFIVYWNTTTYSNPSNAWGNDSLYLLHGIGFDASATADIGSLLVSLLLLQLPDVPLLVNVLLVVPIWASVLFILWFIIKEMIPFV
jgi:hypothetical protein